MNETNGNIIQVPSEIEDGWFSETETMWPGQKFSLALEGFSEEKSILFCEKTKFQSIFVFQSAQHGNVMVLDGVIQFTERDEFVYHEMITHLPLFSHPNPKNILIVGGGDGGVLREVCRHDTVENITLVEIDRTVINVAKIFFSESTATSFDDPRLTIVHQDAAEFLQCVNEGSDSAHQGYDIIIADTSDPVGPAESLFDPEFYERMHIALNDGGIICAQGESFWTHLDLISNVMACCAEIFDSVEYASTMVPTYPCGQIGFILAGKGREVALVEPRRIINEEMLSNIHWYNASIHKSAFVLPQFLEEKLAPFRPVRKIDKDDCFLSKCSIS